MNHLRKVLAVLIVIEIIIFMCFYGSILNKSILPTEEMFKVKERNLYPYDINTNAYPEKHKGNNSKESLLLQKLKRDRPTMAKDADYLPYLYNMTVLEKQTKLNSNLKIRTLSKLEDKKENIETHSYKSNVSKEMNTTCTISFDSASLDKAKKRFLASESFYLFHVHLKMNWLKDETSQHNDDLFHWQYVLKKEKILVQLPIDFDLLTYNLPVNDNEETTLEIQLNYNDSNCNQYNFPDALRSVRLLLWNNLFNNDTKHYLCNRKFTRESERELLYYITTIWVGYDLTCSEISSEKDLNNFEVEKDHLPLVAPIFCYILSLQFVWIFALLDIRKDSKALKIDTGGNASTAKDKRTQVPESTIDMETQTQEFDSNETYPKFTEQAPESTLNRKTQTSKCDTDKTDVFTKTFEEDSGSTKATQTTKFRDNKYCAIYKVKNPKIIKHKNVDIPDIYILAAGKTRDNGTTCYKSTENNSTQTGEKDDIRIVLCPELHQTDQNRCYTIDDRPYGLKQVVIKLLFGEWCSWKYCKCFNNSAIRLLFLLWFFILLPFGLYRTIGRYCILKDTYIDYLTVVRPSEPFIPLMCKSPCKEKLIMALDGIYAVIFPFSYIFVGCISYQIFLTHDQRIWCCSSRNVDQVSITDNKMINERFTFRFYQFCNTMNILCFIKGSCRNCKVCTYKKCEKWWCSLFKFPFLLFYCIFPIIPFSNCNTCKCINDCSSEDNRKRETKWTRRLLFVFLHVICLEFPMSYILCLRPILSTFTFLFRSFTYIVFVALPIRVHILRYTILAVTTATYFVKYFHEIVNMNAEILTYVFICEKERKQKDVTYVEEGMFDFIYGKILFVKKRLYFLVLKMLIVFMYLFITIETFIINQPSLTGTTFKDMLEYLLIIVGPYAISLFLKASNEDFLTNDNKAEIEKIYKAFVHDKETQYESDIHIQNDFESSTEKHIAPFSETPSGSGYTRSGQTYQLELKDMKKVFPDKKLYGDEPGEKQTTSFSSKTHDKEVSGHIAKETDPLLPKETK